MAMVGDVIRRALGTVLRNARYSALFLLAGSEALIVEWLVRAATGGSLGPALGAALACALAVLNVATLALLPVFARRTSSGYRLGRFWLVGSLGALISGPPLALAFIAFAPLAWLHPPTGQTLLLASGGAAVAVGFGSMFWGWLVGQHRVEVERLDLPLRGLPEALAGLRIAQISDLHIGMQLRAPLLRRLIARVNALEADLIVITGDIFDFDPRYIDEGCRELAALEARHGVYAVLGNHDVYTGAEAVASALASQTSIVLLRNAWTRIEIEGSAFALAGVEDPGHGWNERDSTHDALEQLAGEIPAELARVLLIHRPSWFAQAARLGFPLALAGHTHGGQIALPGPAMHHNVSRLISRWTRGLFRDPDTGALLYVNRGLGVAGPPVRLNCAREISLLRLLAPRAP
ncbi:MAG: metallophosphoesterase [Myxococcota bacterium]